MEFSAATKQLRARLGPRGRSHGHGFHEAGRVVRWEQDPLHAGRAVVFPRGRADVGRRCSPWPTAAACRSRSAAAARALPAPRLPPRGGWVLDLHGWDKVRIDAQAGMAQVEAGATVARIQAAAEAQGLVLPARPLVDEVLHDRQGNIACNAGGMHGGKYGGDPRLRPRLEGLPAHRRVGGVGHPDQEVLGGLQPSGPVDRERGHARASSRSATLQADSRSPSARWTLLVSFRTEPDAFRAVLSLFALRIQPAICEFLDRYSVDCAERGTTGKTVFKGQGGRPVVLLELAGGAAEVAANSAVRIVRRVGREARALPPRRRGTRAEAETPSGTCDARARARCSSWGTRS